MIILPTILEAIRSRKDGTWAATFGTQELRPSEVSALSAHLNKYCYLAIKEEPFNSAEMQAINNLKADIMDNAKTPAQRMRAKLYIWWKQDNQGYDDFNNFYTHYIEKFIAHIDQKIMT